MFIFNSPNYYLNGVGQAGRFHKRDLKLEFHMCVVTVDAPLYKQISDARHNKRHNVHYATTKSEVRIITMGANERELNEGNLFQGCVPEMVAVGLLAPESYNGRVTHHPYAFQKFGVTSMKQLINFEEYPYRTLELTSNSTEKDQEGYFRFLQAGGFIEKGEACMLTPGMWGQGRNCTLFLFNNTANGNADGTLLNPKQRADIRIVFTLGADVNHPILVCIWSRYTADLAIDPNGAVLYDV